MQAQCWETQFTGLLQIDRQGSLCLYLTRPLAKGGLSPRDDKQSRRSPHRWARPMVSSVHWRRGIN